MPEASKELTEFVNGIVSKFQPYVNAEPGLLSLLYDIDLLPEQLLHVLEHNPPAAAPNAMRMSAVCALWKVRDPEKWQAHLGVETATTDPT